MSLPALLLRALALTAGLAAASAGWFAQESAPSASPAATDRVAPDHDEVTIGHRRTLESKILGETRVLRVALPKDYETMDTRCGVVYLLDGETLFVQAVGAIGHLSEDDVLPMIVVGIDNTERTRDLTPAAGPKQTLDFPTAGGSGKFRRFLVDELQPFVDSEYRTGGVRVLAGHSFGGLFTVETLLEEPAAFTGYLCMSPSLWWDDEAFVQRLKDVPLDHGLWKRFAWFSIGDEGGMMNGPFEAATWGLRERAPLGFRFGRQHFAGEDHWSAALPAIGAGYREFLAPLRDLAEDVVSFAELEARASGVADEFGEALPIGRNAIASAAYRLNDQGRPEDALQLVEDALEKISAEPFLHYMRVQFLGDLDRHADAIAALKAGIEMFEDDPKHRMPVVWMKRSLVAMRGKLAESTGSSKGDD